MDSAKVSRGSWDTVYTPLIYDLCANLDIKLLKLTFLTRKHTICGLI